MKEQVIEYIKGNAELKSFFESAWRRLQQQRKHIEQAQRFAADERWDSRDRAVEEADKLAHFNQGFLEAASRACGSPYNGNILENVLYGMTQDDASSLFQGN